MAATTRQKFRPVFLEEREPMIAPRRAMGTINQFAHPRNGMTVGIIKIRATTPMMDANTLSMADKCPYDQGAAREFMRLADRVPGAKVVFIDS